MMPMIRCNAISAFVEEEESAPSAAGASFAQCVGVTTTNMPIPMVRCCAMSWTDTEAGQLRVLVARRNLVTGDTAMTEEQTVERAHYTRSPAEKRFMERR
jgi:hypothetical protein